MQSQNLDNQPQAQLAPAQPNPPASPTSPSKKKMPKWAIIVLVMVSVGALVVAGVFIALKDNDKEAQGFLSAIYSSNYSEAYNFFSPQLKKVQSKEVFESSIRNVQKSGLDNSCKPSWSNNAVSSSTSTGNTKEIAGTLACSKGSFSVEFRLVQLDGEYKLYSYSIQPRQ